MSTSMSRFNTSSDPKVNDLSLRFRNTGYAFILAHELGHIRYQHPGNDVVPVTVSQANERQADQFGLDLMRRTSTIPMGAMLFFQAGVYYFDNRADYPSDAAWQAYLTRSATHPLTVDRLEGMSRSVSALAEDFARGQPNRAAAIETTRWIGDRFAAFAAFLKDPGPAARDSRQSRTIERYLVEAPAGTRDDRRLSSTITLVTRLVSKSEEERDRERGVVSGTMGL